MRAAQVVEHRAPMVVGEVPDPRIGPKDALVKVSAAGMCRTDWHQWNGDFAWINFRVPLPVILGHEFAGVVEEVGAEVQGVKPGDRVVVPFVECCGRCEPCLRGTSQLCWNLNVPGATHSGSYAEYVAVPNAGLNCLHLPDAVDATSAASLGCRYSTAWNAVTLVGGVQAGQWVTVFGAGGMGLAAVQIATASGAQVIAVDVNDAALDLATKQGAVATVNSAAVGGEVAAQIKELTGGGAHLSVDCHARHGSPLQSVLGLRSGGRHVHAGFTSADDAGMVALPVDLMALLQLDFTGCMCAPHSRYPELLSLVASGRLAPGTLVTKEISLDEVNQSMRDLDSYATVGMHVITSF